MYTFFVLYILIVYQIEFNQIFPVFILGLLIREPYKSSLGPEDTFLPVPQNSILNSVLISTTESNSSLDPQLEVCIQVWQFLWTHLAETGAQLRLMYYILATNLSRTTVKKLRMIRSMILRKKYLMNYASNKKVRKFD